MHTIKKLLILILLFLLLTSNIKTISSSESNIENIYKNISLHYKNDSPDFQKHSVDNNPKNIKTTNSQTIDYLIITPQKFEKSFQPLINHKSQYMNAALITKEEIVTNKSFWVNGTYGDGTNCSNHNPFIPIDKQVIRNFSLFNDTSAKIRNFIRFAYEKWQTEFVLLGGDVEYIPYRSFYAYIPNWYDGKKMRAIQASIVSDHYYGALNGTWNHDFDDKFGEESNFSVEDEADFIAEVYIGRAPVNDGHEVNVFVNKVVSYETNKKPIDIQLHQSFINPEHIPDTSIVPNACKQWIPEEYIIHELYEKVEKVTVDKWINAFSNPEKLLLFHVGNGHNNGLYSWYQLSWEKKKRIKFNILNTASLSNNFYPIHLSISCLTGDFRENECLAEELLLTRNGGPSACIANSEVGCILPNDANAYSGEIYEKIIKNIFNKSIQHLGKNLQLAKEYFAKVAHTSRQYRWCFYEINLLGDPETEVFNTRDPLENNSHTFIVDDDFNTTITGWNHTHFNSIQPAIDNARYQDTIIIKNGIYKEHLIINKTLNIIGTDKSTVIISNKEQVNTPLVQLSCHSTSIQNVTIKWNTSSQIQPKSLLHILSECNGNICKNTIIDGRAEYSVLIKNSIRNTIDNNWIKNSNFGIGIINEFNGLLPSKIIVTCDNIISNNLLENQKKCFILIKGSLHNYILNNSFINDIGNTSKRKQFFLDEYLHLEKTKLNEIHNNYWNNRIQGSYKINTLKGPITIFSFDYSRGIVLRYFKCILILNMGYPSIVFDDNPAKSPTIPLVY